jgi:hypothetical protein
VLVARVKANPFAMVHIAALTSRHYNIRLPKQREFSFAPVNIRKNNRFVMALIRNYKSLIRDHRTKIKNTIIIIRMSLAA